MPFDMQTSDPTSVSPFGKLPFDTAGRFSGRYSDPLGTAFGLGRGRRYDNLMGGINSGEFNGPLAGFIQQGQALLPNLVPDAEALKTRITGQANQSFAGFEGAVNNLMRQLPNLQAKVAATGGPNAGLGYAERLAKESFDPIASQALYQQTMQGALDSTRAGAAARGTLDSGAAQATEERLARDLGGQFAQNQVANQQNATQILGQLSAQDAATRQNAAGMEANIAGMGPAAQQQLFAGVSDLANLLTGANQLPMDALNQYGSFLAAQQNPSLQLLQMIAPVVGQSSMGVSTGLS